MRHAKERGLEDAAKKASALNERLLASYLHVRLIGSPDAIDAASHVFALTTSAGTLTAKTLVQGFDRNDWDPIIKIGLDAQTRFTELARRDLGLPRKEVGLPATGQVITPSQEQRFIREVLNSAVDNTRGQTSQPPTQPHQDDQPE